MLRAVKRCAITPRHGMTKRGAHLHDACCARGRVLWCRGTTSAVMSCNLAAGYCAFRPRPPCPRNTKFHSDPLSFCTSRTVPAGSLALASRRNKPHQRGSCLTRRVYFAFSRWCKYEIGETSLTVNTTLSMLRRRALTV